MADTHSQRDTASRLPQPFYVVQNEIELAVI